MNRGKVVSSQDREGEPNFQEQGQNSFFLKILTEMCFFGFGEMFKFFRAYLNICMFLLHRP